jgi:hypothetical protein
MLVTILYRHAGESNAASLPNPFGDLSGSEYYADPVKWAAEHGIVEGLGGGLFAPDSSISRQDLAVILARYLEYLGIDIIVTEEYVDFADEAEISDYARNAVQLLNKLGIINGKGANADGQALIDPSGEATRAEAAAMLHRFIEALG